MKLASEQRGQIVKVLQCTDEDVDWFLNQFKLVEEPTTGIQTLQHTSPVVLHLHDTQRSLTGIALTGSDLLLIRLFRVPEPAGRLVRRICVAPLRACGFDVGYGSDGHIDLTVGQVELSLPKTGLINDSSVEQLISMVLNRVFGPRRPL